MKTSVPLHGGALDLAGTFNGAPMTQTHKELEITLEQFSSGSFYLDCHVSSHCLVLTISLGR